MAEEHVSSKVFDNTVKRQDRDLLRFKDDVASDIDTIEQDIKNIMYRLPVWATILIAILTGIIGWLADK